MILARRFGCAESPAFSEYRAPRKIKGAEDAAGMETQPRAVALVLQPASAIENRPNIYQVQLFLVSRRSDAFGTREILGRVTEIGTHYYFYTGWPAPIFAGEFRREPLFVVISRIYREQPRPRGSRKSGFFRALTTAIHRSSSGRLVFSGDNRIGRLFRDFACHRMKCNQRSTRFPCVS